jgi:hypothetical protein
MSEWDFSDVAEPEPQSVAPRPRRDRRQKEEQSGGLFLFTGALLGVILGLVIALVLMPVRYVDSRPDQLSATDRDRYRALIAQAYLANGDMGRAWARLTLLGDANPREALSEQARRLAAQGGDMEVARALAQLSAALGQPMAMQSTPTVAATPAAGQTANLPTLDPALAVRSPTPVPTATLTLTPRPTSTPRATPTLAPTLGAPFLLVDRQSLCDETVPGWDTLALIQVETLDGAGNPAPNIRVIVSWAGGSDTFYTGLYPEISLGYADFAMTPGVVYSVQVGDGGEVASNLQAPECTDRNGVPYWGRWRLTFRQP